MDSRSNKQYEDKNNESQKTKKVPGLFSRITFFWILPLFYNGYRRDLFENDLIPPKGIYNSKLVGDKLEKKWLEEEEIAKSEGRDPSLARALFKAFGWYFIPGGILHFINVVCRTSNPLIFSEFLKYWSKDNPITREDATYYAIGMILFNILAAVSFHHATLSCQQFGMLMRIATSSLIFRKLMRLDSCSLGDSKAGKVVNILSNDLQRFDVSFTFIHTLWIVPIRMSLILYLCYTQSGIGALTGCLVIIVMALPIQAVFAKLVGKARFFTTQKSDTRIKIINEVISGIQVIKMYAWEKPFEKLVQEKREEELKGVKLATTCRTLLLGFVNLNERFAIFVTVLVHSLLGHRISAHLVYPLQQLLISIRVNFTFLLPMLLSFMAEIAVTFNRVEEFLSLTDRPDLVERLKIKSFKNSSDKRDNSSITAISYKEVKYFTNNGFHLDHTQIGKRIDESNNAVEMRNVSVSWTGCPNDFVLKDISVSFPKGKLSAIIGSVGAGKSLCLEIILKELPVCSGNISVLGKVSYACQDAWLLTNTVRENIIFGLPFEECKYKKVCKACSLEKDFQQLPYGDQTLVGERGVMVSGGQRARINLARAVYREADIYLLDDPLSAVDANVGRQLFDGCINGYLRGRTRILVTHQVHFLKAADFIVVLDDGRVQAMGSYQDLVTSEKSISGMLISCEENNKTESHHAKGILASEKLPRLRAVSISKNEELPQFEAQKLAAEKRESGNLRLKVITEYFLCGSHWSFVVLTVALMFISCATTGACDYWVTYWTNQMAGYKEQLGESNTDIEMHNRVGKYSIAQYIIYHACLIVLGIVITNVRVIPYVKLCLSTCNELHRRMLSTMLRGTMRFFDGNSTGRILNRFVKDIGAVDDTIPRTLMDLLQVFSNITVISILNAIALYWTLIPTATLILISIISMKIYLRGAQGIKRIESTCKSPVFDVVTSTLNGIKTVRACESQERLIDEFDKHQDLHTFAWNGTLGGSACFGAYLDIICTLYQSVIIFALLFIDFGDLLAVGDVGLALTQTTMLLNLLQYGLRNIVEFIAQLTSVERILEYTHISTEENISKGEILTPSSWPNRGKIVFENVNLYYNPKDSPVLKNLDIVIESGSKVGIVGRTGAGKSSLISAIFRFAHIEGKIIIDDVNTLLISKQDLRSNISVIPQEPVLFSATVRYNLDPFNTLKDDEIWRALELVNMKAVVSSLDDRVTEGGANFSVGQRQLMCLARAVLRSNKILIMDEATANVDPQTDGFIQQTIRRQFASCTVLTIAHRLNTIMDSDRVLVMDRGQVEEYDHPYILLSNPNSKFSSMVREMGEKSYDQLYEVAKDAYILKNRV